MPLRMTTLRVLSLSRGPDRPGPALGPCIAASLWAICIAYRSGCIFARARGGQPIKAPPAQSAVAFHVTQHSGLFRIRVLVLSVIYRCGETASSAITSWARWVAISGARCSRTHDAQQRSDRLQVTRGGNNDPDYLGAPAAGVVLG
jgi:hypothetical protein